MEDEKNVEQKVSDGLKMTCMIAKMVNGNVMKDLNELDMTLKLSTLLAMVDRDKALKMCDAGRTLESAIKELSTNLDVVIGMLKDISELTEEDEKRLASKGKTKKNGLSEEDNDMLNKLFGDE